MSAKLSICFLGRCFTVYLFLFAGSSCFANEQATSASSVESCIEDFRRLNSGNEALQAKAAGVLIFSRVGKGERQGINPEYGEGVLRVNGQTVGTYSIQTPSKSPTIGVAYHQLVILFMTPASLAEFRKARSWTATDEVGMAIVATGHRGDYDEHELRKPILAFEFGEEGIFDNLYLDGSVVRPLAR